MFKKLIEIKVDICQVDVIVNIIYLNSLLLLGKKESRRARTHTILHLVF